MPAAVTLADLFAQALQGDYEDDAPWAAVNALRRTGSREVFEQAAKWAEASEPLVRARGLDVLAQLGKTAEHLANSFPQESYAVVIKALGAEREIQPLSSAISALGHLDDLCAVPFIANFEAHPDAKIRFHVACALGSFPNDQRSAEVLLRLSGDTDEDVRDWATFGLGVLGDADSAEVREALYARLSDSNRDVREEALVGLAKRRDVRAIPVLIDALEPVEVTDRVIEAAYTFLGLDGEQTDWSRQIYLNALRQQFRGSI